MKNSALFSKTALVTAVSLLIITACHTSSRVNVPPPGEPQLAAAKTRFPDVTVEQLKQGHGIFYGACTKCHNPKDISGYTEVELSQVLDKMAVKAKLNSTQKEDVWKYMITLRTK